jgi:hypothetical protein
MWGIGSGGGMRSCDLVLLLILDVSQGGIVVARGRSDRFRRLLETHLVTNEVTLGTAAPVTCGLTMALEAFSVGVIRRVTLLAAM